MIKRGLILLVGSTGSGKSTTLAAMINHRNENASDHIVTIEDPIEFLHTNKRSIINQREVGLDTRSYERALRGVMRAAPDVILIGEIRDRESMQAAISLAGTGHLVLATLHANNCAETLDRIIEHVPARPAPAGRRSICRSTCARSWRSGWSWAPTRSASPRWRS